MRWSRKYSIQKAKIGSKTHEAACVSCSFRQVLKTHSWWVPGSNASQKCFRPRLPVVLSKMFGRAMIGIKLFKIQLLEPTKTAAKKNLFCGKIAKENRSFMEWLNYDSTVNRKSHWMKGWVWGHSIQVENLWTFYTPGSPTKTERISHEIHGFSSLKFLKSAWKHPVFFLPILVVLLIPKRLKELDNKIIKAFLGGGFKHFLCSPQFGEDSHFDSYFSDGFVQPPTRFSWDLSATFQALLLERLLQADVGVSWLKNPLLTAGRKMMGNFWILKTTCGGVTSKKIEYQDIACYTPISRLFAVKTIVKSMMIQV